MSPRGTLPHSSAEVPDETVALTPPAGSGTQGGAQHSLSCQELLRVEHSVPHGAPTGWRSQ